MNNFASPPQLCVRGVGDDKRGLGELTRQHGTSLSLEERQDVVLVARVEDEGVVGGGGPHLVKEAVILEPSSRQFSSCVKLQ